MDVVDKIAAVEVIEPAEYGIPKDPVIIRKIEIVEYEK